MLKFLDFGSGFFDFGAMVLVVHLLGHGEGRKQFFFITVFNLVYLLIEGEF